MQLFEYAIMFIPTKKENKSTESKEESPIVIKQITSILAKDINEVNIRAAREIPEEYLDKLSEVNIAIRPF